MATLSLVIPAYNEQDRLPALLDVLATSAEADVARGGLELLETLIVDDGSDDGTRQILVAAAQADPKLTAVIGPGGNRGKGAAIAEGVGHAKGDYALFADTDLSTPLSELSKLTAALSDGADIAIGSRGIPGAVVERGPAHRKLLGKSFNGTVRLLTRLDIRDTQCGFKLLPTDLAKQLLGEQVTPGFAYDVELLMRAKRSGMRIAEVPVLYIHDSRSRVRVVQATGRMLRDVALLSYRLRDAPRQPRPKPGRGSSLTGLPADDPD